MKITISGKAGSGKSTVAKLLSRKLSLQHHSIGDFMRQIAQERNVSLLELSKQAEQDESIDKELDDKQIALNNADDFVIDGRLTAHFIKNADLKVFLDCDDEVRVERILKDKRKDEQSASKEELAEQIKAREESEHKRYQEYYGVDYTNKGLYDVVVDTSSISAEEVVEKIVGTVNET